MDAAFEAARIIGYLILMPGLVLRAMFLFNRCMYMDTLINISGAFFYFALTTPSLVRIYDNNNDPFFLIPATIIVILLAIIVLIANVIDIYHLVQYNKQNKVIHSNGN